MIHMGKGGAFSIYSLGEEEGDLTPPENKQKFHMGYTLDIESG